jgi:hypothetical protein
MRNTDEEYVKEGEENEYEEDEEEDECDGEDEEYECEEGEDGYDENYFDYYEQDYVKYGLKGG